MQIRFVAKWTKRLRRWPGLRIAPGWQTLTVALLVAVAFWLGGVFDLPVVRADDGLPLCATGQEYDAGLCYATCKEGYDGVGPVCWQRCPTDYKDDGALCRKDAIILAKDTYPANQSCKDGYTHVAGVCWEQCKTGYTDTGAFCRKTGTTITKDSYPATQSCGAGYTNVAGICWQQCPGGYTDTGAFCEPISFAKHTYTTSSTSCQSGYDWVFFVCWQKCPSGYTDTGAFCRYNGSTFAKDSYPATQSCQSGYTNVAGICWQQCPAGYTDTGAFCEPESIAKDSFPATYSCGDGYTNVLGVCWQQCPAGYTDDGALCRKDAIIFAKDSYGRGVGTVPDCDINNLDCDGNFEASNDFRPKPNGYEFENWGDDYDESTDFDNATLIRMFGASNICQTGDTAQSCVLTAATRTWRQGRLTFLQGGHCYGMATSSQMFFAALNQPGNYQSGAANTYDLETGAAVRSNISEMAVTQSLSPADGSDSGWIHSGPARKPSDILNLIRTQLQSQPTDPYVLAIYKTDASGATTGGHAVTPYAIQDRGNGVYWLHIYDNNWPEVDRYIVFNVNEETWLYGFGATNPASTSGAWQGTTQTATLSLRPTSVHRLSGWSCSFCNGTVTASGVLVNEQLEFSLSGRGRLLVIDPQQKATGWDFNADSYVNTIPGAEVIHYIGGTGIEANPTIRLPLPTESTPFTVYASGDAFTQTATVDFMLAGPGYTVGVNGIVLAPQQNLRLGIRPDGRQIAFSANETGTFSPTIVLASDANATGNGYIFDVGGIALAPGKTVTVTLDLASQTLHFADNNSGPDTYTMELLRITATGEEQLYQTDNVALNQSESGAMNFGAWDGVGAIEFTLDGQTQPIENEATPNNQQFLPLITK